MKMNPKVVMMWCLAFTIVLILGVLHYSRPAERAVHAAIVYDRSMSPRDGCDSVRILAETGLALSQGRRADCTIKIFATGDKATAYEPVTVALPPPPKKSGRVLEGKGRFAKEKDQFLSDTYARCGEIARTEQSPIFLSVKRACEYLRSLDPHGISDLHLLIQTDLEENIEPLIKQALREPLGTRSKLPQPIDNSAIKITFCGYSDTASHFTDSKGRARQATPPRSANSADRLLEVWRKLFTQPDLVAFAPVCERN